MICFDCLAKDGIVFPGKTKGVGGTCSECGLTGDDIGINTVEEKRSHYCIDENGEKDYPPIRCKVDGMYGYDTPYGFFYPTGIDGGEIDHQPTKRQRHF